ncbi:MAG TPA: dTMP kinase [Polyangiaceae bacterium]
MTPPDQSPGSERRFPGLFVVIEGTDGCGSTTHSKLLAKSLRQRKHEVVLTCEPTPGPIGSLIRQVLARRLFVPDATGPRAFAWSTMALLFAADRMDHLDSKIVPALRDGMIVVSDRYELSSLVYQSVTAPNSERALPWIRDINGCALRPDVTVVIDVPAEVAEERRKNRGGVEELFESREIQRKVAAVYAKAEELVPGDHLVHVSGVGEPGEVGSRILEAVLTAGAAFFERK